MSNEEKDIVVYLQWLGSSKTPPDAAAAAMARLLAAVSTRQDPGIDQTKLKAEQHRLEHLKGPRNPINKGMVMAPPAPGDNIPDGERRAAEIKRLKKPFHMPAKEVS